MNPALEITDAAQAGDTERITALLATDGDLVNAYNADGWTPLHLAVFYGHLEAATLLLARGADVHARSRNALANQPLHAAAAEGSGARRPAVVALLLEHGADVNARQHGGWTALHAAAQSGDMETTRVLVEHGADVNLRNDAGVSPLVLALQNGEPGTILVLRVNAADE